MSKSFWISKEGKNLLSLAEEIAAKYNYDISKTSMKLHEQRGENSIDKVRQAAEIVYLRYRAKRTGQTSENSFFTTSSFEQTSSPMIAEYHASYFKGARSVLEICTGAGGDTAAIAKVVDHITTIEKDPLLAELAELNFAAQSLINIKLIRGNAIEILESLDISKFDGLFADPSRRAQDGRRIYNPEEYDPKLSWIMSLNINGVRGIKISPGYNFNELPSGWVREWIGFKDECREQILWRNTEIPDGSVRLVDLSVEWHPDKIVNGSGSPAIIDISEASYLIEPHAALIRSSKLAHFYSEYGINLLDSKIAYGVSDKLPAQSPFYSRFKIVDSMPFDISNLKNKIRQLKWNSRTEIKKRGIEQDPEMLRKKLKFCDTTESGEYGVILLVRTENSHLAVLAKRVV